MPECPGPQSEMSFEFYGSDQDPVGVKTDALGPGAIQRILGGTNGTDCGSSDIRSSARAACPPNTAYRRNPPAPR